jgi:hypothetical protein
MLSVVLDGKPNHPFLRMLDAASFAELAESQ